MTQTSNYFNKGRKASDFLLLIVLALGLNSCSSSNQTTMNSNNQQFDFNEINPNNIETDDFSVSGTIVQNISFDNINSITVRCYCKQRAILQNGDSNTVLLNVSGTHDSVGYHGDQKKPTTIDPELLHFVVSMRDKTMVLESNEYTYMHHAALITDLQIIVPPNIDIVIETKKLDFH